MGAPPNRLFDPAGYLCNYPDAKASGLDPLRHFTHNHGAALGYHPHALFETNWYLAAYADVSASGLNPLAHYLRKGEAKGYHCTPLLRQAANFELNHDLRFVEPADPEVTVVIPVYGRLFDTLRCLYGLASNSDGVGYEVIVLDDNPQEPVAPFAPCHSWASRARERS